MMPDRMGLAATLAFVAALSPLTIEAATPEPMPESTAGELVVRLEGPFGSVVAGTPGAPALAYPGVALDAWIPAAPLRLEISSPDGAAILSSVTSRHSRDGDTELLSDGVTEFAGPSVAGESVITALIRDRAGVVSQHAWLVLVPDREGAEEALFELVPPAVQLTSESAAVRGEPGNGCYAYLCSDVGGLAPLARLELLPVRVGETLAVRTGDGSGLVGWLGRLHHAAELGADPIVAEGDSGDGPAASLALPGLEVPAAGEWLLELRVDYDRERGWTWHAYRLVAQ